MQMLATAALTVVTDPLLMLLFLGWIDWRLVHRASDAGLWPGAGLVWISRAVFAPLMPSPDGCGPGFLTVCCFVACFFADYGTRFHLHRLTRVVGGLLVVCWSLQRRGVVLGPGRGLQLLRRYSAAISSIPGFCPFFWRGVLHHGEAGLGVCLRTAVIGAKVRRTSCRAGCATPSSSSCRCLSAATIRLRHLWLGDVPTSLGFSLPAEPPLPAGMRRLAVRRQALQRTGS